MKNIALILSGGEGKRFDKKNPKQLFEINGRSILEITVSKFVGSKLFEQIVIVSNKKYIVKTKKILNNYDIKIIEGGNTRQESVFNGLKFIKKLKPKNVVIHDSVRPFFTTKLLEKITKIPRNVKCIVPALKINDSVRLSEKKIYKNIVRDNLKLIQTPQGFNFEEIFNSHKKLKNKEYTDDSILVFENGCKIKIIEGEFLNYKITDKSDIKMANQLHKPHKSIKVGQGFDVHQFTSGKSFKLCGVEIPFTKTLKGHSDADVGIHALVDAILGAIAKGDIGEHFPPSQAKWKNVNSEIFLKHAMKLLKKDNFVINNIDLTIICEKPKISKYKNSMKKKISNLLSIDEKIVNIKGTTTERLGFLGREEGIACQAIISIINEVE
ncbi:MAG: bifunctional 2-C-methyl-D-erythritol 4-phosphate cytidylyltransferase/2-C-methyl-D-erythritol 2,4-cyclodiphosphate synthase [Alphaproteobacteria bacterium]